jgi:hypothetical protein
MDLTVGNSRVCTPRLEWPGQNLLKVINPRHEVDLFNKCALSSLVLCIFHQSAYEKDVWRLGNDTVVGLEFSAAENNPVKNTKLADSILERVILAPSNVVLSTIS